MFITSYYINYIKKYSYDIYKDKNILNIKLKDNIQNETQLYKILRLSSILKHNNGSELRKNTSEV